MPHAASRPRTGEPTAWIITGPTSGIGLRTALELARHGTVVLVGRSPDKLADVQRKIERDGGTAVSVVCDLSDIASVRNAARQIMALKLTVLGLCNNAGIMPMKPTKNSQGRDAVFATNHLGPFALTEALLPSLPDGAHVVFIASAVEDPERRPAKIMGMRGGRYISAEASARGEWLAGGSRLPGADAYATSKQAILAATFAFAREIARVRFSAIEPGINPSTGLGGDVNVVLKFIGRMVMKLPPFRSYASTPAKAARLIAGVLTDASAASGLYYDEKGRPMRGSAQAEDPEFQGRVVAQTRALLAQA